MDWDILPLGWGESHELGHNLQNGKFSIGFRVSFIKIKSILIGKTNEKNKWKTYIGTSGENSCNIYPYYNKYRHYRITKGLSYLSV
jgi:hypothetical protein